jgi:CDP-paratose 2-epimerase
MKKIVITGAAGFIGSNLALFLKNDFNLVLLDNFSRIGSEKNRELLLKAGLDVEVVDVSNSLELFNFLENVGNFDSIIHLAAQTSLLESLSYPKLDFDTNALGTLNILEFLRIRKNMCQGIFLASNKVYGNLNQFEYIETNKRYRPSAGLVSFDESLPILPIGGYSISKSISDAYVAEYGKRYDMPVISIRQSAVYGPNQNSRNDQGWVSYFIERFKRNDKVLLRGKGKQVRDILYIEDFSLLVKKLLVSDLQNGEAFNVGGGVDFSLSILELFDIFTELTGRSLDFEIGAMADEDQKYFVSNNSKISKIVDWKPTISPIVGVEKLLQN